MDAAAGPARRPRGAGLPDFPWDSLAGAKARAAAHPGGLVDLSVGTPVDPTPEVVADALRGAANAPGYPQTHGTPALRETVSAWFARRRGVPDVDPDGVLPTIGSKELVAWLPMQLGLGPGDVVAHPGVAYPTYDVGARLTGARPVVADGVEGLAAAEEQALETGGRLGLVWLNSPSNPTGAVVGVEELAAVVAWARERGVVVASDECYAELGWDERHDASRGGLVPSLLDPRVCGGDHTNLLCVYSTSKQSNLAGYRARRDVVRTALEGAGFRVDASGAGLYLWSTLGRGSRETVDLLAERGVLAAPGDFYGAAGAQHVRIALTATDERIAQVPERLAGLTP